MGVQSLLVAAVVVPTEQRVEPFDVNLREVSVGKHLARLVIDERAAAVASQFRHTVASEYGIVALFLNIDNVWQPTIGSVWQSLKRIDILCR